MRLSNRLKDDSVSGRDWKKEKTPSCMAIEIIVVASL